MSAAAAWTTARRARGTTAPARPRRPRRTSPPGSAGRRGRRCRGRRRSRPTSLGTTTAPPKRGRRGTSASACALLLRALHLDLARLGGRRRRAVDARGERELAADLPAALRALRAGDDVVLLGLAGERLRDAGQRGVEAARLTQLLRDRDGQRAAAVRDLALDDALHPDRLLVEVEVQRRRVADERADLEVQRRVRRTDEGVRGALRAGLRTRRARRRAAGGEVVEIALLEALARELQARREQHLDGVDGGAGQVDLRAEGELDVRRLLRRAGVLGR